MRLLHGPDEAMDELAGRELAPEEVLDLYPWPAGDRWVRAMMVTTLDGAAAGPDGLSGSISSAADQEVFAAVRRLTDAVLVGGGTLRAEGYGPMPAVDDEHAARLRRERGKRPAPVLAVVSGSLDLPWDDPVFTDSAERVVVLTGTTADDAARARAREHAGHDGRIDLVELGTQRVGAGDAFDALADRGLPHVVCEGGPSLLEDLVQEDRLDEADITLSPVFAGTANTPRTPGLEQVAGFVLAHVLTGDDGLMNRYLRHGDRSAVTAR